MYLQAAFRGARAALRPAYARALSDGGIGTGAMGSSWKDRESAAENLYFSKADAEALQKLATKLKTNSSPTTGMVAKDKQAIAAIFSKHGVTPPEALVDDLVKHKYPDH